MNFGTGEEEVIFLKKLWSVEKTPCPECGRVFRTVKMLRELPEK